MKLEGLVSFLALKHVYLPKIVTTSKMEVMADDCDTQDILKPLVFRLHENAPAIVREVLLERGWTEFDQKEQDDTDWNLYWRNSPFRMTDHHSIKPWQRLNHYPEAVRITRKDYLARHLKRYKLDLRLYVCVTSFCPLTIYTYEEGLMPPNLLTHQLRGLPRAQLLQYLHTPVINGSF
ncbi:putative tubulin polyglutamylase TTLL2 [Aix galericulata]|nr:putative tubulin polyglutamylase TTLL2 [Aix galericulata]